MDDAVEPLPVDAALAVLREIFRPASPTVDRRLFRGREVELNRLVSAIQEVGRHAVVYGERGVGKTSLALMGQEVFLAVRPTSIGIKLTCNAEDDYESIWRRFPEHLLQELEVVSSDLRDLLDEPVHRIEDLLTLEEPTADSVARALYLLGSRVPALIVIDEFDRIANPYSTVAFADLIKGMSDNPSGSTLVLVGVGDNVDDLVMGHASVDRALGQVQMPRMSEQELREVVVGGVGEFTSRTGIHIEVDDQVVNSIVNLSQGFPYYTHLLAGSIMALAVRGAKERVERIDVFTALVEASDSAVQSIRSAYAEAVTSSQGAGFEDTLLACALARTDVAGFFRGSDVIAPRAQVSGQHRVQAHFNHHLKKFAAQNPKLLDVRGESRFRYRFSDPLMKPFVLMQAFRQGKWNVPD